MTKKKPAGASLSGASSLDFIDASGGALAALAAGVARSLGAAQSSAATSSSSVEVPSEIATVLAEIGVEQPVVELAARGAAPHRVDVTPWGLALYDGDGDLERLAAARIARDRIERRLLAGAAR